LDKERPSFSPPAEGIRKGGLAMLLPGRLRRRSQFAVTDAHRLLLHSFILSVAVAAAAAASLG
jgi:hypothetical protein